VADRYDSMTTAELQAEADSRTPAVDLSGATTNAQRAELLRDAAAATPTTTTASSGGGDGTGIGGDKDHGELTHGHAGYSSQDDLDSRLAAARGEASPRMATSGWRQATGCSRIGDGGEIGEQVRRFDSPAVPRPAPRSGPRRTGTVTSGH
jgi:hypothetical protein